MYPWELSTGSSGDYVVPGWNDYVKEKHGLARDAFLEWKYWGNHVRVLVITG